MKHSVPKSTGIDQQKSVIIAVPARLESIRLPRKVLEDINGKPMLQHVLERCMLTKGVKEVVACSDSHEIFEATRSWGFHCIATDHNCDSGSDRLASVADQLITRNGTGPENSLIINVQADQPFVDHKIIEKMIERAEENGGWTQVITPVYPLIPKKISDPNVVKVLKTMDGRAITFSRSPLPHVRDVKQEDWHKHRTYWGHVGIYGYRGDILKEWRTYKRSDIEAFEKLEQYRLIEAGIQIRTFEVATDCDSIDTQEQLVEARLSK